MVTEAAQFSECPQPIVWLFGNSCTSSTALQRPPSEKECNSNRREWRSPYQWIPYSSAVFQPLPTGRKNPNQTFDAFELSICQYVHRTRCPEVQMSICPYVNSFPLTESCYLGVEKRRELTKEFRSSSFSNTRIILIREMRVPWDASSVSWVPRGPKSKKREIILQICPWGGAWDGCPAETQSAWSHGFEIMRIVITCFSRTNDPVRSDPFYLKKDPWRIHIDTVALNVSSLLQRILSLLQALEFFNQTP